MLHRTLCLLVVSACLSSLAGNPIPTQARTIRASHGPTLISTWQGLGKNGPETHYYAISMDGLNFSEPRATDYQLKLVYGQFDPLEDMEPFVPQPVLRGASHHELFIVQFVTQPLDGYRAAIKELGGKISFFLPRHATLVRIDPSRVSEIEALPFVRWVGAYQPAYRIETYLTSRVGTGSLPPAVYNIMVTEGLQATKSLVAEKIRAISGTVVRDNAGKFLLEARLTETQLLQVAGFDEVLYIDRWSPYESDMDNLREIGGANHVETMDGYTGAGVRGEVIDSGFNLAHMDFQSRPLIEHTPVGTASHGAATSGIVFGDGTADIKGRGLLPDAQGMVASTAVMTGTARYDHTGELVKDPYFAVFQTSSVGSGRTANYTTISADTDASLFDFDILHCQSQSNAGTTQSRPQAWAKNILSGGGANHQNNQDPTDDCWCFTASIGPATDGRIKPDLASAYDGIYTTTSGSPTAYTTGFGGTSGATPIICGHSGLVFQMWHEGIFGNPVVPEATVFENRPHMTTAKALLINSAEQWPFSTLTEDMTRVHQGWGRPNVQNLYDRREKTVVIDETDVLTNMQSISYELDVEAAEPALKATMIFADPPGNPGAAMHRINDLSLKVTSPSGTIYWGNNGLMAGNWSTPDGERGDIDTVENVYVENPEAGTWTITVSADEVNEDSHTETPDVDADFALVVSGATINLSVPCPNDLNEDGVVDATDYLLARSGWTTPILDINENGFCDIIDLMLLEGLYGACP